MERNPRSRTISLRLSAQEYEALRTLYPAYGARSISDFARLAMTRVMSGSFASEDTLLIRLNKLDERLSLIEALVTAPAK